MKTDTMMTYDYTHARHLLGDILSALPRDELAARIRAALPHLAELTEGATVKVGERSMVAAAPVMEAKVHQVQWPKLFEPRWGTCEGRA